MNVSFLSIEEDDMSLIGYELKLSPAEKSFLLEIINKDGATIDDLLSLLPDEVSRGNVAVRILVGLPAADVVRNCHIDISRDAEVGESADVHDPSAVHADGAADVPAFIGSIVAEVRIDGAGSVHGAHILAVASVHCGIEDGR